MRLMTCATVDALRNFWGIEYIWIARIASGWYRDVPMSRGGRGVNWRVRRGGTIVRGEKREVGDGRAIHLI